MTFEEYLNLVITTATKNLKPGSRSITAAALGSLLKQASPQENWKNFGIRTLGDLLSHPTLKPRLQVIKTDKGALAVALSDGLVHEDTAVETFSPLRKAIWEAFIFSAPNGRRFMHRDTGMVRLGLEIAPTPADEWVEIVPVSVKEQRDWAKEFVSNNQGISDVVRSELDTDDWLPSDFIQELRSEGKIDAVRDWNRLRSSKVSARVQGWLTQHTLPRERGFQVATTAFASEPAVLVGDRRTNLGLSDELTRQAILSALATLPLNKLLELPMPAGVLLTALSKTRSH